VSAVRFSRRFGLSGGIWPTVSVGGPPDARAWRRRRRRLMVQRADLVRVVLQRRRHRVGRRRRPHVPWPRAHHAPRELPLQHLHVHLARCAVGRGFDAFATFTRTPPPSLQNHALPPLSRQPSDPRVRARLKWRRLALDVPRFTASRSAAACASSSECPLGACVRWLTPRGGGGPGTRVSSAPCAL
jgi:hypothetical protein